MSTAGDDGDAPAVSQVDSIRSSWVLRVKSFLPLHRHFCTSFLPLLEGDDREQFSDRTVPRREPVRSTGEPQLVRRTRLLTRLASLPTTNRTQHNISLS